MDVAQLTLYLFWGFFFLLVLYLHRENKREGYPLETARKRPIKVEGFPGMPEPKTYHLPNGQGTRVMPRPDAESYELKAAPAAPGAGSPLYPTGNPLVDGVGPAAWAIRPEHPDLTVDGRPKIVPMRLATDWVVDKRDPDPRGKPVYGTDGEVGGTVTEIWVDQGEPQIRYFEVEVADGGKHVMLPINFTRVRGKDGHVMVKSIKAAHFKDVPAIASPDQITLQEEDRVVAYYGGGCLYATKERSEPLL
jgi:photosynthetic reaction center H subunit